jgi:glycosyltransferase involved in cell wall biosynthesis
MQPLESFQADECVTVVVPVYNLERYLKDAIRSIQQQAYPGPLEIIILDDGSSDNSFALAQQLSLSDTRIRVFHQSNCGRAETRRRLLEMAGTELVGWLDADDLASPRWLQDQVSYLSAHPECAAVGGQGYAMTSDGHAVGPMLHPLSGDEIDHRHICGHPNSFFQSCVTMRRSIAIKAGSYDPAFSYAEDYSLWLRMAEHGQLANVDQFHLYYRIHSGSANWTANTQQRMQGRAVLAQARARRGLPATELPLYDCEDSIKDDWNRRIYWIHIAMKSGNPISAIQMLREAIRRHPYSMLFWLILLVAILDLFWFRGNRVPCIVPGVQLAANARDQASFSFYELARRINRWRRRILR